MAEILSVVDAGCRAAGVAGVAVTLMILEGRRIGTVTLNLKVGVEGGVSVIGTTGFVEPWDNHLAEMMTDRVARASDVVITTGRIVLRFSRLLSPLNMRLCLRVPRLRRLLWRHKGSRR